MIEKMISSFNSLTIVQQIFISLGIIVLWLLVGYIVWNVWALMFVFGWYDSDACIIMMRFSVIGGFVSVPIVVFLVVNEIVPVTSLSSSSIIK